MYTYYYGYRHASNNLLQHILELTKKLNRANGILSKLRYNTTLEICLQVYYAIFYSYLIYGCNVWGFTSEENINAIQVLQNKCLRIMTFAPYISNVDQSFLDLKLLKVRDNSRDFPKKTI